MITNYTYENIIFQENISKYSLITEINQILGPTRDSEDELRLKSIEKTKSIKKKINEDQQQTRILKIIELFKENDTKKIVEILNPYRRNVNSGSRSRKPCRIEPGLRGRI